MNSDGTYTVKGSADLMVGPGAKEGRRGSDPSVSVAQQLVPGSEVETDADVALGAGAVVEFKFDSLTDAQQGARSLIKLGMIAAGGPSGALAAGPLLQPSSEETEQLLSNISAIQLDLKGEASASASNEESATQNEDVDGMSIGLNGTFVSGRRLEFENGKPVAIVQSNSLSVSGSISSSLLQELGLPTDFSGTVNGAITQRFEAPDMGDGNLTDYINELRQDPAQLLEDVAPTYGLSLNVRGKGGYSVDTGLLTNMTHSQGIEVKVSVNKVDPTNIGEVVSDLTDGDIEGAIAATGATSTATISQFSDTSAGLTGDIGVAKLDFRTNYHAVNWEHQKTIKPTDDGQNLEIS
jgi:hypothetical protein